MSALPLFGTTAPALDLPLRPYQMEALDAIDAAYRAGQRRQLISMPTGAGKTVTFAHLIKRMRLRTVVVVHRDELVRQTVDKVQQVIPSLSTGVVKAERDELSADVIVASAQTLAVKKRLERLCRALGGLSVLLVSDECHHDRSPSRTRVIEMLAPALLTGWTATAMRGDGLGLDAIYGPEPVFHLPMIDLIADGKLSPMRGLRIETEADLDAVHTRHGELAEDELAETIDTPGRNELIVRSWQQHARERRRTVAFCINVAHAEHLRDAFRAAGIAAECIVGETPADERARLFDAFHRGDLPVLTNCMVLTEGYDEPAIDCVVMARPTKSQGLYIQCVGRGARRADADGKADCLVLDFVDVSSRHKLVTLPILAGSDEATGEAGDGAKGRGPSEADRAQGELIDLLTLAQKHRKMRERAAIAVNLFGASRYIWSTISGHHMAPAGDGSYLVLLPEGDSYRPTSLIPRRQGAELRPLFDRGLDLETAMAFAESRVASKALAARDAEWRTAAQPATTAQMAIARQFGIAIPRGATKGAASNLIDKAQSARLLRAALGEMSA